MPRRPAGGSVHYTLCRLRISTSHVFRWIFCQPLEGMTGFRESLDHDRVLIHVRKNGRPADSVKLPDHSGNAPSPRSEAASQVITYDIVKTHSVLSMESSIHLEKVGCPTPVNPEIDARLPTQFSQLDDRVIVVLVVLTGSI